MCAYSIEQAYIADIEWITKTKAIVVEKAERNEKYRQERQQKAEQYKKLKEERSKQ